MPLYGYDCAACGGFTAWRPMSRAAEPAPCPTCEAPAPRRISAPFLADMDPSNRIAHQRNERSAHEPRVGPRESFARPGAGHHGHRHGHRHKSRPWMIGH